MSATYGTVPASGPGGQVDDDISANARERYVHFRAPDGQLYELVERRSRGG